MCDGFVGNVALKTAEGLASMLSKFIQQEFTRNLFAKLAALVALPVLKHFKPRVDHRRYNGAALLGLRGLVFKSHGSADAFAFEQALNRAYDAARNGLLDRVHDRIVETLAAMPSGRAAEQTGRRRHACLTHLTCTLFAHHRHRQLSAAAPGDQRRPGRASWPPRHRDVRPVDRRAHRHPRPPFRRARRERAATWRCEAARHALEAAGRKAGDIDLIIVATSTPDMVFPSAACIVQQKLGVAGCAGVRRAGGVLAASSTR